MVICDECGIRRASYPVVENWHTSYYCAVCLPAGSLHLLTPVK